jgi:hypothetical protein
LKSSIASISRSFHAQRPTRGLPGGALCVSWLAARGAWWGKRGGGDAFSDRVGLSNPRYPGLAPLRCRRRRVVGMGFVGLSDLASFASGHPALGTTACGRGQRQWRLVVDRSRGRRAASVEWHGARARSSRPCLAALLRAGSSSAVGLGGGRRLSSAMERFASCAGGEPSLNAVRIAQALGAAGHAPLHSSSFTPWVIFPRA